MLYVPCRHLLRVILFIICCCIFSLRVTGQETTTPLSGAGNRAILNNYRSQAESFVAKNLNRFGLEQLRRYDASLDSLYKKELADTLQIIEKNFAFQSASKKQSIDSQKKKISELTGVKSERLLQYHGLLRKALFAFTAWFILILLLLQFRKRKLWVARNRFDESITQLKAIQERAENGTRLLEILRHQEETIHQLAVATADFDKNVQLVRENLPAGHPKSDDVLKMVQQGNLLSQTALREEQLFAALLNQESVPGGETEQVNINELCEQYLEIATRGFQSSESGFSCSVTRDFEKKLPGIKLVRADTGNLLLNILQNAFLAVKEKQQKEIKGYEAKVAVSTRILPRFLQIRVKDNGIGMDDATRTRIQEEFFSTRQLEDGAGLGLSSVALVFNDTVKGEIKIESEPGNGTDVYIKFFIA